MPDNRTAVEQADEIYRRSDRLNPERRARSIELLASHGLWSMPQISRISGAGMHEVRRVVDKSDRTGGRFHPDTLTLILEEFRIRDLGQTNDFLTLRIVSEGTSIGMLARLLDVEIHSIRSQIRRATKAQERT